MTESPGDPGAGREPSLEERAAGLLAGAQRWVIRRTARNVSSDIGGQVRRALRGPRPDGDAIWTTATTEDPSRAHEPPECAWCPICRAARALARAGQQSGPRDRTRPSPATGRAGQGPFRPAAGPPAADSWAQAAAGDQAGPGGQAGAGEDAGSGEDAGPGARLPAGPAAGRAAARARPAAPVTLASAPQALAGLVGDAIRLVESVLSYRPPAPAARPPGDGTDEPDDRG